MSYLDRLLPCIPLLDSTHYSGKKTLTETITKSCKNVEEKQERGFTIKSPSATTFFEPNFVDTIPLVYKQNVEKVITKEKLVKFAYNAKTYFK